MPHVDIFADKNKPKALILTKKEQERVSYLERILPPLIIQHGKGETCTHPETGDTVSDTEFDKMWSDLEKLKPDSVILKKTASAIPIDPNAKKMKHDPPMTSIKKANGTLQERQAEFEKWLKNICTKRNISRDKALEKIVCSYKHDGAACSLKYVNGELVQAGMRSDDRHWGEDITENIKFVKDVPLKLPVPITCIIRGELECKISTFNRLNGTAAVEGQEFANPRNYTTGSIRQFKDPQKTKTRELSFVAYRILGLHPSPFKTERECAIWCNKTLKIPYVRTEFWNPTLFEDLERKVPELDYEVDGIVVSFDNLEEQEQLGTHGDTADGDPKGKIAWKFADDTADPIIDEIVWETGRTGHICPVVTFKGVKLAGTIVKRAAGHSLGFLLRNKINVGTQIKIRKSGKIIPEVLGHFENNTFISKIPGGDPSLPATFDLTQKGIHPDKCPSCNQDTKVIPGADKGMYELHCEYKDCPSRNIKRYCNYLEKFGVKGVGEATVERLVEAGIIKNFCDFYNLSMNQLQASGETLRTALLTIARIHMVDAPEQIKDNQELARRTVDAIKKKKHISLSKFIACLGIPGASKGTGFSLALHFRDIDKIINATENDFASCADIGEKTAKALAEYLSLHKQDISGLLDNHLNIELPKTGRFTNQTFVFTGGQPEGKDYWKDLVEQEGGLVKGSVSVKTNYVIVGTDPGEKYDKAKELLASGTKLTIVESHAALVKLFE